MRSMISATPPARIALRRGTPGRGENAPCRCSPGPVWQPRRVRMRLARRPLVAGFLLAVALAGVTGCRTDPNVAAYVGDTRITESELDSAVQQRLEDPAIAQYAHGHEADYTRKVLGQLVDDEVYTAVARRYGVTVDDDAVRTRIHEAIGGQDPEAVYGQLAAQQGISRTDVFA